MEKGPPRALRSYNADSEVIYIINKIRLQTRCTMSGQGVSDA